MWIQRKCTAVVFEFDNLKYTNVSKLPFDRLNDAKWWCLLHKAALQKSQPCVKSATEKKKVPMNLWEEPNEAQPPLGRTTVYHKSYTVGCTFSCTFFLIWYFQSTKYMSYFDMAYIYSNHFFIYQKNIPLNLKRLK